MQKQEFDGLTFDELVKILRQKPMSEFLKSTISLYFTEDAMQLYNDPEKLKHAGDLFEILGAGLSLGLKIEDRPLIETVREFLESQGLVTKEDRGPYTIFYLTDTGRRFRNRLMASGDLSTRIEKFWTIGTPSDSSQEEKR
jgi:hypothetical protein